MVPPNATKSWSRATPNPPEPVLLLQPYSTTLYSPTALILYSPTTVLLLQPYSTTIYSPTAPTGTLYSNTPTTNLPMEEVCSISHTVHAQGRTLLHIRLVISPHHLNDSYSKTPMRTSHPISPRALLQATPASEEPSGHQPHP
ncbi:hypothetical protein ACOMHN_008619 [Nucella lapillus]